MMTKISRMAFQTSSDLQNWAIQRQRIEAYSSRLSNLGMIASDMKVVWEMSV
jgi:hypothetical protein